MGSSLGRVARGSSSWTRSCWGGAAGTRSAGCGDIATGFLRVLVISFLMPEWGVWLLVILLGVLKDSIDCMGDLVAVLRDGIFSLMLT